MINANFARQNQKDHAQAFCMDDRQMQTKLVNCIGGTEELCLGDRGITPSTERYGLWIA